MAILVLRISRLMRSPGSEIGDDGGAGIDKGMSRL